MMPWREAGATWENVAKRLAEEEEHLKTEDRKDPIDPNEIPVHDDIEAASKALGLWTAQIAFTISTYASRCQMAHAGLTDMLRDHNYDGVVLLLVKCRALAAQAPCDIKRRYLQTLEHFANKYFIYYEPKFKTDGAVKHSYEPLLEIQEKKARHDARVLAAGGRLERKRLTAEREERERAREAEVAAEERLESEPEADAEGRLVGGDGC